MYEIGKITTAPESWRGRDQSFQVLGTKMLEVMRHTVKTVARMTNVTDSVMRCDSCLIDIFLVFNVVSRTQGQPLSEAGPFILTLQR